MVENPQFNFDFSEIIYEEPSGFIDNNSNINLDASGFTDGDQNDLKMSKISNGDFYKQPEPPVIPSGPKISIGRKG